MATRSARSVDRILIAGCIVIWLVALGVGVAATVALVDLGRGHVPASAESTTPWLLYAVIGISALVIAGAVPLLMRARRTAWADSPPARSTPGRHAHAHADAASARVTEAQTEKLRVFGTIADPAPRARPTYLPPAVASTADTDVLEAVERVWLRCTVGIAGAMGTALIAVGAATYLMTAERDNSAWAALGLAGLITLVMPVIPWNYLRRLRAALDELKPDA